MSWIAEPGTIFGFCAIWNLVQTKNHENCGSLLESTRCHKTPVFYWLYFSISRRSGDILDAPVLCPHPASKVVRLFSTVFHRISAYRCGSRPPFDMCMCFNLTVTVHLFSFAIFHFPIMEKDKTWYCTGWPPAISCNVLIFKLEV